LRSLSDHDDDEIFINLNDDQKENPKSQTTKKEEDLLPDNSLYQEESTGLTEAPYNTTVDPKEQKNQSSSDEQTVDPEAPKEVEGKAAENKDLPEIIEEEAQSLVSSETS